MHAVSYLGLHRHASSSLHLLRHCSAQRLPIPCRTALSSWSSTNPTGSTPHHNLGEDPPPYSLQPTSAQRHESMAESGAAEQNKPLKPIDPVTKRYDDMHESYGEGYFTRSSEEGFGGIYSSPLSVKKGGKTMGASHDREDDEMAPGDEPAQEYDQTQGHPVTEKEKATRHGGGGFTGPHDTS